MHCFGMHTPTLTHKHVNNILGFWLALMCWFNLHPQQLAHTSVRGPASVWRFRIGAVIRHGHMNFALFDAEDEALPSGPAVM